MRNQYKILAEKYRLLKEDDSLKDEPRVVYGDTEGIEPGTTGMPYGAGHSNRNKDFDKIVNLNAIHGVTDQTIQKYNTMHAAKLQAYIKQLLPWIQDYSQSNIFEPGQSIDEIIQDFFRSRDFFLYWANNEADPNQSHQVKRREQALAILEKHPNALQAFDKALQYVDYVSGDSPNDPDNLSNYPLQVSLYDITQQLGGHEEGGWWYEVAQLIKSVKVTNPKQAEAVAKQLY
ncbi:MAG: hypothetical protein EB127_25570, partial [Alphaproteobacteria bacterium]|nr:hypothetical protein [Alphaproteobacteria bacterium]